MKFVYIVFEYAYEDSTYHGPFSSIEKAELFVEEFCSQNPTTKFECNFRIDEKEVL